MKEENVNQQTEQIEACCEQIINANPSDEVRKQVQVIQECCRKIDQDI